MGLREEKKAQVRDELAAAAMKLFQKRGFDAVTVDEIVGEARVSRRSFFRYFPTKEAAFFARRNDQTERLKALLAAPVPGEAPFDTVRRVLLALADEHVAARARILVEHKIAAKAPLLIARDLELDRAVTQAFAAALAKADPKKARLTAAALIGVLRVVIEDWVEGGATSDLRAAGEHALRLIAPMMK